MSTVQDPRKTWLATGSLLLVWQRMPSLGLSLPLAFQLWLLPARLSSSGWGWASPQPLALLWNALSPLFCEWGLQCLRLELFVGTFSLSLSLFFSSLSLWLAHSLGCYSTLAPSDCPQGIQAQSLTLSNAAHASLFSPRLLVADASVWATSPLHVAVRHIICGFYLFIFFLPVMLPSEIPKLSTDPQVRGFPGICKLLLFYDSLRAGGVSICNSIVSLFIFYILSYLLLKTMGCLSGCLVSSTSIQKLFCGICSAFR